MLDSNISPDAITIKQHLQHITGRWSEVSEECLLELVILSADDKAIVRQVNHYEIHQLDQATEDAESWSKTGANVYATVNPVSKVNRPPAHKRAKAENILGSFFHWADADDAQAAQNIKNFVGPQSTFYTITGTKPCVRPHVYWELQEFTRDTKAWSQTQRAIAATLGTDPAVVDPPRIMRLAGTVNWPKPQKTEKGYIPELVTLHIYQQSERPLVSSDRMARAFPSARPSVDEDGLPPMQQDGKGASEFLDILSRAQTDGQKHGGVRDLAASLAGQGVNKALAEAIIRQSTPVWDDNVEDLINSAYSKFYQPNPEPEPIEATPQTIADFKIDTSDEFLADLEPLEYLIDGILPRGVVYSLTGFAGHGKTTLALQFGLAIAEGGDFHGRECSQGDVLILAGENPYNVKYQYAAALAARDLKTANIHFVQGRFSIQQWAEVVRSKMEAIPNLKLVIVDSLQAFFEGDNDNDNAQMVQMAHKIRDLGDTKARPAMLIIAHPAGKKPDKDGLVPRGGGAFLNEIDGNLTVWSNDGSQQTLHHTQKFRGAGFDPLEWVMQINEFDHLTDAKGTPLKLPVSRPEMMIEKANREVQTDKLLEMYLDALDQKKKLSEREAASQWGVSRRQVRSVIETAKDESLIKRHARTWVLTKGGKDFLEAKNAGE